MDGNYCIMQTRYLSKGKYVKKTKSRIYSILFNIIILIASCYSMIKLRQKFKDLEGNYNYFKLLIKALKKSLTETNEMISFAYQTLMGTILLALIVKMIVGILLAFLKKSLYSYNHFIAFNVLKTINFINLIIIFCIQVYAKLIDLDIFTLPPKGFVTDIRNIKNIVPVIKTLQKENEDLFVKVWLFVILNVPLLLQIVLTLLRSILSFYALYFLFFPFIVFSLFVYFSFMKRSYVKYIFEDFDEEYYKINLVKGKSYIKKLILSVILISVLGISTLYFYNNPSDFSLPNLFILRRYSASDGGMPISNKTNNILVGLLVGYGINGVLMFILFAVKLRHARLMRACAEQFSEGYVINN